MAENECPKGQVPYRVISGGGELNPPDVIRSGCIDYYIAQPYLNDDNFAVIPEDIFNSVNLLSPDAIKKAQEWNELKEAYENGEATLQDLKDFDPGVLSGLDGWLDYYNDFISGEEDRSGDVDYGGATGEVVDTTTQGPEGDWNEDFGVEVTVRPPRFPTTESKRTDGGGGLMTGGGIDTGTTGGPGPATESKRTDGGTGDAGGEDTGDGRLDVLGEDWEYDPEHDYIYVGDCTFVRVDENGNPIGEPTVSDYCPDDVYVVGGNYSGPDSKPDPTKEVIVDIFGEGSIIDTTKDNTEPEEKDKDATETEEKEKDKNATETEEKEKDKNATETEEKEKDGIGGDGGGGDGGGEGAITFENMYGYYGNKDGGSGGGDGGGGDGGGGNGDGGGGDGDGGGNNGGGGDGGGGNGTSGGEGVVTFQNMYGYYGNKDGGGGNGGGGDGDGNGGDGDGNGDGGEEGSMFKDVSLGGTSGSAFTPFQAVPGYTAPTYAPINVPQQDYMAAINNLIARNSSMFKGYI